MILTDNGANNIFRVVEQIQLGDIQNQAYGYFGLLGNGNDIAPGVPLPIPLRVSGLTHLSYGHGNQQTEKEKITG